jgi:hypothetical protein
VTAVEPYPAAEDHRDEWGPNTAKLPSRPGPPAWAAYVLRRQILAIICDVIDGPDTQLQVRQGLQQHLDDNPGRPERALVAHLHDLKARESRS